jgi:hypothetical protein
MGYLSPLAYNPGVSVDVFYQHTLFEQTTLEIHYRS